MSEHGGSKHSRYFTLYVDRGPYCEDMKRAAARAALRFMLRLKLYMHGVAMVMQYLKDIVTLQT